MLLDKRKMLLEGLLDQYQAHAVAPPGAIGNAYKCSAPWGLRVARIYAVKGRRDGDAPEAAALCVRLGDVHMEHGRAMLT